jgi:peptidoglycan/xylan/chitin deacetylase (PgdA/CDA1 family)
MKALHLFTLNACIKRFSALAMALLIVFPHSVCGANVGMAETNTVGKYETLPAILAVTVDTDEREIGDDEAYVYKEYLNTANSTVNEELRAITDAYDKRISPTLPADPKKRGNRNSRLEVDTIYYRTGDRYISAMVQAFATYQRTLLSLEFTKRTYDLQTARRLYLTDLFAEDSPAWDILEDGVKEKLESVFPDEERDEGAVAALCCRSAIEQADFTLSGMELTLHYSAGQLFTGKTVMIHVRFFYPQFDGMMTETGRAVTDNSRWKMIAITCDDGPKDYNSSYALTAFRNIGARITYFIAGKQLDRYADVFEREFNQNQLFGNHSYHHWSGYSFKQPSHRKTEAEKFDALALALVGERAAFFRAPGGTYPPWQEAEMDVPIIQWSANTYDYTGLKPRDIIYAIEHRVEEYDIVLCHDTGKYLYKAIPTFGQLYDCNPAGIGRRSGRYAESQRGVLVFPARGEQRGPIQPG